MSSSSHRHDRKRSRYARLLRSLVDRTTGRIKDAAGFGHVDVGHVDADHAGTDRVGDAGSAAAASNPATPKSAGRAAFDTFLDHTVALKPLVRRRVLPKLPGLPPHFSVGWVQFPETGGDGYSLAVFTDRNHCAPIAFVDRQGRVFAGTQIRPDVQRAEPVFLFAKESEIEVPRSRLDGQGPMGSADGDGELFHALQGGIVGRDETGEMTWLASWLKADNRYTLEQMRADLPVELRADLEFRDAIAIAFFAAYLLPTLDGFVVGFGAGNIFRRLRREAPIGAIRRSIKDTMQARAHGMRASGLEDHFADLMNEAGALDTIEGLEAVHGAEPLHLYSSPYSGAYFFGWDSSLEFRPALASLRIEGNLNRFAAVSMWLERNSRIGVYPTEDTVTRAQAAQLDRALLLNPALTALPLEEEPGDSFDPVHGDGTSALMAMVDAAREAAQETAGGAAEGNGPDDAAGPVHGGRLRRAPRDANGSEWVYRQTFSSLVRKLRLPYRFDVEFRSNLAEGNVAIGFTTAGTSMMPSTRYDETRREWVTLTDAERASFGVDYNLRVGLMLAALAFGVDSHVSHVSLHIDSIGLEEAVAEQNSAISAMMNEALTTFERMRTGSMGGGTKADPKDGDFHGNPSAQMPAATDVSSNPDETTDAADGESVDQAFQDLMRGTDLDEMAFSLSSDDNDGGDIAGDDDDDFTGDYGGEAAGDAMDADGDVAQDDPIAALRRNPTVRNLVTVTFDREAFLDHVRLLGLSEPRKVYRDFRAVMDIDGAGALQPINAEFDIRDNKYSPLGSQEEPELSDQHFSRPLSTVLGAKDALGLSIQRADVLQHAVNEFHRLADDPGSSVDKARHAMEVIQRIADPELFDIASDVTSALIDGRDTPDAKFTLTDRLDAERVKARDLLFGGQPQKAMEVAEAAVADLDSKFAGSGAVPRYFNSYAERVVYNRLFATPDERTLLIPDNLFYAHMELADVRAQLEGPEQALPHLNAMVSYAPAYPLSHLRLSIQLARAQDWDSARAACLNALRVALDRDDAAFAYYRLAYAEWMRDEFDVAAAAYLMSDYISSGAVPALEGEFNELMARARSQCIPVPQNVDDAKRVLAEHDLPVWPAPETLSIVRDAARMCVDNALFVPARTLSMAAARMDEHDGLDAIQIQFLRSLNN
ncbi:tetratricopeptide repeat protein [Bifidobacterium sp. SMB2]|uniref:Tetratricopeptide repeat protein n=2 Tax=Bifidobacterium TaxID=1678 RepID=A0ABX0CA01_9BIFI|nr:tetratricopeptide repeat protein [Bifidobacterium sp. SMB2]NEH11953.1 tetratricopeptide repeat protein [Bifidobacterium saimiriisciurei]